MNDTAGNIKINILISSNRVAERMLREFALAFKIPWTNYKNVRARLQQEYEKRVFPPLNNRIMGEVRARLKAEWEKNGKKASGDIFDTQVVIEFNEWTKLGKDKKHYRRSQEQQRINVCYDILNGEKPESNLPSGYDMDSDGSSADDDSQPNSPPPPNDGGNNQSNKCNVCKVPKNTQKIWFKSSNQKEYCVKCYRSYFIDNFLKKLVGWNQLHSETQEHYCREINKCKNGADFKTLKQMVLDTISKITFTCSECNKSSPGKRWGIKGIEDKIFCSKDCATNWQKKNQTESEQGEINSNGNEEGGMGNEGGGSDFGDNSESNSDNNHNNIPNQNNLPNQNENGQEHNEPSFIQEIAKLPLPQAQIKAEQEIEKLLKDNSISDQELEQEGELGIGKVNWKDYLKSLDTPQKVAEFANKLRLAIVNKVFNKTSSPTQKNPKNDLTKPIAILVLSLLVLTTLIIIVRKRRQKKF